MYPRLLAEVFAYTKGGSAVFFLDRDVFFEFSLQTLKLVEDIKQEISST